MRKVPQQTEAVREAIAEVSACGGMIVASDRGFDLWFREPPQSVIGGSLDFYHRRNAACSAFRNIERLVSNNDLKHEEWGTAKAWGDEIEGRVTSPAEVMQ